MHEQPVNNFTGIGPSNIWAVLEGGCIIGRIVGRINTKAVD